MQKASQATIQTTAALFWEEKEKAPCACQRVHDRIRAESDHAAARSHATESGSNTASPCGHAAEPARPPMRHAAFFSEIFIGCSGCAFLRFIRYPAQPAGGRQ